MKEFFKNGYGVSIISTQFSYGLELAVLEWNGVWDKKKNEPKIITGWRITYDTEITDDVVGNLDANSLNEVVNKVKNLEGEVSNE